MKTRAARGTSEAGLFFLSLVLMIMEVLLLFSNPSYATGINNAAAAIGANPPTPPAPGDCSGWWLTNWGCNLAAGFNTVAYIGAEIQYYLTIVFQAFSLIALVLTDFLTFAFTLNIFIALMNVGCVACLIYGATHGAV